jgi:hypothetical protein
MRCRRRCGLEPDIVEPQISPQTGARQARQKTGAWWSRADLELGGAGHQRAGVVIDRARRGAGRTPGTRWVRWAERRTAGSTTPWTRGPASAGPTAVFRRRLRDGFDGGAGHEAGGKYGGTSAPRSSTTSAPCRRPSVNLCRCDQLSAREGACRKRPKRADHVLHGADHGQNLWSRSRGMRGLPSADRSIGSAEPVESWRGGCRAG